MMTQPLFSCIWKFHSLPSQQVVYPPEFKETGLFKQLRGSTAVTCSKLYTTLDESDLGRVEIVYALLINESKHHDYVIDIWNLRNNERSGIRERRLAMCWIMREL